MKTKEDWYREANRAWLKFCCFMGWHRWKYDPAGRFRTCAHNWCSKMEERKK